MGGVATLILAALWSGFASNVLWFLDVLLFLVAFVWLGYEALTTDRSPLRLTVGAVGSALVIVAVVGTPQGLLAGPLVSVAAPSLLLASVVGRTARGAWLLAVGLWALAVAAVALPAVPFLVAPAGAAAAGLLLLFVAFPARPRQP